MQNVTTLWNLVFQITKDINYLEYMKCEDFFLIAGKRINFVTFEAAGWKKARGITHPLISYTLLITKLLLPITKQQRLFVNLCCTDTVESMDRTWRHKFPTQIKFMCSVLQTVSNCATWNRQTILFWQHILYCCLTNTKYYETWIHIIIWTPKTAT